MKHKFLVLLLVVFTISSFAACRVCMRTDEGPKVTRNMTVKPFEKIETRLLGKVVYTQGEKCSVRLVGNRRVVESVRIDYAGDKIILSHVNKTKIGFFNNNLSGELTVYVSSPDLIAVDLIGTGEFEAKGKVDTDTLQLLLKGTGEMTFYDVICDHLRAQLHGTGDMGIKHVVAASTDVSLHGTGDIDLHQQNVQKSTLGLLGTGDMDVDMVGCGDVTCELRGTGDITLKGTTRHLVTRVQGTGDIHSAGLQVLK